MKALRITSLERARQTSPYAYGIGLILASAFFFSLMSLCVRLSRQMFRPDATVFYRNLIQVLVLLPGCSQYFRGGSLWDKIRAHFPRGAFGVVSMFFLYIALHHLPLGLAYLLAMTSAPWATLLARVFLKETLTQAQAIYGSVCLVGVATALVLSHREGEAWGLDSVGVMSGLAAGFCMGMAMTILRRMRGTMGTREIVFFFGMTGMVFSLPGFWVQPQWPRDFTEAGFLLLIGVPAAIGQLLLTTGFRYTTTMAAATSNLSQILITLVLGFFVLGEKPPWGFYLGAGLLALGIWGLVRSRPKAVLG